MTSRCSRGWTPERVSRTLTCTWQQKPEPCQTGPPPHVSTAARTATSACPFSVRTKRDAGDTYSHAEVKLNAMVRRRRGARNTDGDHQCFLMGSTCTTNTDSYVLSPEFSSDCSFKSAGSELSRRRRINGTLNTLGKVTFPVKRDLLSRVAAGAVRVCNKKWERRFDQQLDDEAEFTADGVMVSQRETAVCSPLMWMEIWVMFYSP